jgi:cystathionine beta-synthase
VSQLPVTSASDPNAIVGSIGERGLLRHAVGNPALLSSEVVGVMEPPFPAVSTTDPARDAVEMLSREERSALLVTEDGRPVGIVTRADLLESLVTP